jgi:Cu/Ag efflux protein CusF
MKPPARPEACRQSLFAALSALAFACALVPAAVAQTGHAQPPLTRTPATAPAAQVTGRGIVKKIDTDAQRLTLAHEPIEALNWPAMTMPFPVANPALLTGVKAGDAVRFGLNGEQVIVSLEAVGEGK